MNIVLETSKSVSNSIIYGEWISLVFMLIFAIGWLYIFRTISIKYQWTENKEEIYHVIMQLLGVGALSYLFLEVWT